MHVAKNLKWWQLNLIAWGIYDWEDRVAAGDDRDLVFVSICKKRRHRSVAGQELIRAYLSEYKSSIEYEVPHGPYVTFPRYFCENRHEICDACRHRGAEVIDAWKAAVEVFTEG